MKLDAKVKGGLAWAGLVVILAVPAADILFGKSDSSAAATAAAVTSDAQAGKPKLKLPTAKPAATATDPITASVGEDPAVDKFLKSGKKLPSYISDADEVEAAAVAPPATTKSAAETPPMAVASAPAEEPPVPLPRSARPKTTEVASLPDDEKPLILDEKQVQQNQAAVEPFPLSDEGEMVTDEELQEWDSGSLADYLERKELLSKGGSDQGYDEYDPDGFYLDAGPNKPRRLKKDLEFWLF